VGDVALAPAGLELLRRVAPAAGQQSRDDLVADLLARYGGTERGYHDRRHLAEVLAHVDELADVADDPDAVRLAAWFHDAVYTAAGPPGADEAASAALALESLTALGVDPRLVAAVVRLVELTATHRPEPGDRDGAVLCDADLAVLARDPAGYADYVAGVRHEYAHVPAEQFRAGRAAILRELAAAPTLFRTDVGRARWEPAARANLDAELAELDGVTPP
jgi:predicted metal-dependent HD superfamily phosphohydrolase